MTYRPTFQKPTAHVHDQHPLLRAAADRDRAARAGTPMPGAGAEPPGGFEMSHLTALIATMASEGISTPEENTCTAELARLTALELDFDAAGVLDVVEASMLRGLGKLWVPAEILTKRGALDRGEVKALHEHPRAGAEKLRSIPELARLAPLVKAGCERFDGKGYPEGLSGEQIPLASRIVFACNAYGSMITERSHREALDPATARLILASNAGGQFCPTVVGAMLKVLDRAEPATAEPAADLSPMPASDSLDPPKERKPSLSERWARSRTPSRIASITYPAAAFVGMVVGVWFMLPVRTVGNSCPPAGEGRTGCVIQKVWVHEFTLVLLITAAVVLLAHLAVFKLPDIYRRARAGELREKPLAPSPVDPILVAASWGWGHEASPTRRKPNWQRREHAHEQAVARRKAINAERGLTGQWR